MIRIETIAEPVANAATPSNTASNRIENVRRSDAAPIRSTRESYNAYQRKLMAARRALTKADQARLATDAEADAEIERQRRAEKASA
jgi:hypothetical protein